MRYMLMMHAPGSKTGEYQVNNWAPEDFKAHIAFMHRFNQELTEAGVLVGAEGLAPPGQARVVRAGKLVRVDDERVDSLENGDRLLYIRSADADR